MHAMYDMRCQQVLYVMDRSVFTTQFSALTESLIVENKDIIFFYNHS